MMLISNDLQQRGSRMISIISSFWANTQQYLFPIVDEEIGPISAKLQNLIAILDFIRIEEHVDTQRGRGRPPKDRIALARTYVAKVVLKLTYNEQLRDRLLSDKQLRRICGWNSIRQVPSLSKFSRVFSEFADKRLPEVVHEMLISRVYKDEIVGHMVIDSTPVEAREKPFRREEKEKSEKTDDGAVAKSKKKKKRKHRSTEPPRTDRQTSGKLTLEEMINDLSGKCTIGKKKKPGSLGFVWKGYKLHLAVDDGCVPLAAILTPANLNDHEAAIPLTLLAKKRARCFYQLGDSAYDVKAVKDFIGTLGHRLIVDQKPYNPAKKEEIKAERKRQKLLGLSDPDCVRYRERAKGERANALVKEYYGGDNIQYKGFAKVRCHLMFGVLTLAANLLLGIAAPP